MEHPQDSEDSQRLFAANLPTIRRVVSFVCRRNHLSADEAEDFGSHAQLRLFEHDCAVLRRFRGGSSMQAYLSIVVERLFTDHRRELWGKWCPSAEATRQGATAVLLDRLISRDGYTVDQAYEFITTNHRIAASRAEVEQLAAALPPRRPRRFETDEDLADKPADTAPLEDVVAEGEAVDDAPEVAAALRRALDGLTAQDRLILVMRFFDGWSVPQIGSALGLEQKGLYRRVDRLLHELRQRLEADGIDKARVLNILRSERAAFELAQSLPEISGTHPSLPVGARE